MVSIRALGPAQIAILRTVADGGSIVTNTPHQQRAALRLHALGLLDRDIGLGMSRRFIGNDAGSRLIRDHDIDLAGKDGA